MDHPNCSSCTRLDWHVTRKLNLAATLWNNFSSSPVRRSSSSSISSGESRHFAVLRNSLISLALGPPASSVSGVATPRASVSPRAFKARDTCCWSGSYSIHHCRNVSVLPKKLIVRDCDDSGPRVTTLLSSYAPRSKLICMLSPLTSAHYENIVTVHQNVGLQAFM